ncbi:YhcN/YlaJ family sporulation lipoprotein [Cytobacillus sp. Hm23]
MRKSRLLFLMIITIIASSCTMTEKESNEDNQMITKLSSTSKERPPEQIVIDQTISQRVMKEIVKQDRITQAIAVNIDEEVVVAFKVKHVHRWFLADIEDKAKKALKKEFPDYKITVSRDLKIFIELTRLKKKINEDKLDKKKAEKELNDITLLSKEEA